MFRLMILSRNSSKELGVNTNNRRSQFEKKMWDTLSHALSILPSQLASALKQPEKNVEVKPQITVKTSSPKGWRFKMVRDKFGKLTEINAERID